MNLVFHLVSALTAILLTLLILRLQRQRQFLLVLLQSGQKRARHRILVETPTGFLARYAQACDVAFSPTGGGTPQACRIDPAPWLELFWRCQPTLIECSGESQVPDRSLHVRIAVQGEAAAELPARLAAALGTGVHVEFHHHDPNRPPDPLVTKS